MQYTVEVKGSTSCVALVFCRRRALTVKSRTALDVIGPLHERLVYFTQEFDDPGLVVVHARIMGQPCSVVQSDVGEGAQSFLCAGAGLLPKVVIRGTGTFGIGFPVGRVILTAPSLRTLTGGFQQLDPVESGKQEVRMARRQCGQGGDHHNPRQAKVAPMLMRLAFLIFNCQRSRPAA